MRCVHEHLKLWISLRTFVLSHSKKIFYTKKMRISMKAKERSSHCIAYLWIYSHTRTQVVTIKLIRTIMNVEFEWKIRFHFVRAVQITIRKFRALKIVLFSRRKECVTITVGTRPCRQFRSRKCCVSQGRISATNDRKVVWVFCKVR